MSQTTFIIVWLAGMAVIAAMIQTTHYENVLGKRKIRTNWLFAVCVFFPIFIQASFRGDIADSYAYLGDFEKASSGIRDSVRYTIIFEDEDYTQGVDNFLHQLENLGYYDIEVKNNWSTNKDDKKRTCQGINVKLKSREGMYFEIQFHTPNSHDIKETNTRRLYRVIRDKNAPDFRRNQANNLRILLQSRVNAPDNIEDYRFISNNNSMRR